MFYFGFAIADSMFQTDMVIERTTITSDEVHDLIATEGVIPCLNPSHKSSIDAMTRRFGFNIEIPETPPKVSLKHGDDLIVMGVRGLPRLTDRHEYTDAEIATATFEFTRYHVRSPDIIYIASIGGITSRPMPHVEAQAWSKGVGAALSALGKPAEVLSLKTASPDEVKAFWARQAEKLDGQAFYLESVAREHGYEDGEHRNYPEAEFMRREAARIRRRHCE